MAEYIHGIKSVEINEGTRPIRTISTAVIGLLGTNTDGDQDAFPVGETVLVTDLKKAAEKAGGTLKKSLEIIANHTNAIAIVLACNDEESAGAAVADAFLKAKAKHEGITPRIFGAPGIDDQATTAALVSVAKKLRGFVYAKAQGETLDDILSYRKQFGDRELMLIENEFLGYDKASATNTELEAVAVALGLRAKLDQEIGWHKTLSNVPVNGVTGIKEPRHFDLMSSETEVNLLNSKDVTSLICEQGFRFWGSRTCSADPLFAFESYTRTAQVIIDTIGYSHLWAMDKPLTPGLATDIVTGVDAKLKELTAQGYLLGGSAWYDPKLNTPETLKDGQLHISYDYTPVPPLEQLHFRQHISATYLIDFAKKVTA